MARQRDEEFDPWAADPYMPASVDQTQLGSFGVPINSQNPAGYQDLSYWQSRHDEGLPGAPSVDDIFDTATGQLKPGWKRTAKGYEFVGGQTAAPPPPQAYEPYPTTYPTYTGGGGGMSYQAPERRPLAALNYPQFSGPTFAAPKPFTYEDFTLPTLEEAQNEPGFDYALKQGIKAYENSKAYLGTYRSGGTIKGLNDYARNMATQNYDKVFDRKAQTYDRNRSNAADAYATNYGISRDVFDRNYTSAKDTYAPKAREAELNFARDWDVYAYEGDDDYRRWKALVDANAP